MARIAYVYDVPFPNVYAATTQILATGRELAEIGHTFTLFAAGPGEPTEATLARLGLTPHPGFEVTSALPARPRAPALRGPAISATLAASSPWRGADAVLSRGATGFALARALRLRAGPPFFYEMHRIAHLAEAERALGRRMDRGERLPPSALRIFKRERAAVGRADALILLTEALAEEVRARFDVRVPVLVAPSGVTVPDDAPAAAKDVDLVFLGKVELRKGIDLALATVACLPAVTLRVIGDGPWLAQAQGEARALGIAGRVEFVGRIRHADVPAALARARVGLCPLPADVDHVSEHFSSPMKLLEMMAVGLPIAATGVPAVRAICTDGRDALLAPKPEPHALAECVAALLADDGLRRRLADAARERVTAFSWHRRARSIGEFVEAHRAR